MSGQENQIKMLELTTEIVVAHVSNNTLPVNDLPQLIQEVYKTLENVGNSQLSIERLQPAISVKKSISPDYIVCLEDGKKLKMLKRHLRTTYGMTPDEYRAKWDLPVDYPMVAPNYAKQRSEFAKKIGLGRRSRGRRKKA